MSGTLGTLGMAAVGLAAIIALSRVVAAGLRRLRQPPVIAEIVAGILLGAGVLGTLAGDPSAALFPSDAVALLRWLGNAAIVVYLAVAGTHIELGGRARDRRAPVLIGLGAFFVPFVLGLGLALLVYPAHATVGSAEVERLPFVLFLATAVAITALPVLARIIADHPRVDATTGRIALAAAGVQELFTWPLVALSIALATRGGIGTVAVHALLALGVVVIAARLLAPLACRLPVRLAQALLLALAALAAIAAGRGDLHLFVGALAFGALLPPAARDLLRRTAASPPLRVVLALGLPAFFALPAMRVEPAALFRHELPLLCGALVVAVVGKALGSLAGARVARLSWTRASLLAALMNTRGLVELVVLSVGLSAGLLDVDLFSVMVVVALVTTLMTGPLIDRVALVAARSRSPLRATGHPTLEGGT